VALASTLGASLVKDFQLFPMIPSKRKATGAVVIRRKIRRLERKDSDPPRPSSSSQSFASTKNSNALSGDDDSNSDVSLAVDQDNVPQRIKVSKALSKPHEVAREMKLSSATSTFTELGVSSPLVRALGTMSIRTPTPVQAACIPPLIAGMCHGSCSIFRCTLT
jgi:ATP-dependent RNA helicase DDX49/DBP8